MSREALVQYSYTVHCRQRGPVVKSIVFITTTLIKMDDRKVNGSTRTLVALFQPSIRRFTTLISVFSGI